ncbi:MAG: imidazoleglycerol-phosphate dehydratase HisB [Dehalococcoidales bacterium]|nr:imidazoleglycerol-phosphate dehydratase HisB [Dehalococcoidales bacterium]
MRSAEIERKTNETDIKLKLILEGTGVAEIATGCGFLDHMLNLFSCHSKIDLSVACVGDTEVDFHHTTEDVAICLGQAYRKALGEKNGIGRYGDATVPMDEALIMTAVDISGRGGCYCSLDIPTAKVGDFDTELCEEFWQAFARESGITIHIRQLTGKNAHHIIEGVFKSAARSIRSAVFVHPNSSGSIPSTKGSL